MFVLFAKQFFEEVKMLINQEVTFENMTSRFGEILAYSYLEQIERAAGLSPVGMTGTAPEMRLLNAIRAQNELHAAMQFRRAA